MSLLGRLTIENHRGRPVPRTLGLVLAGGVLASTLTSDAVRSGLIASGCLLVVLGVGLVDDLSRQVARGIRGHLFALAAGRPTTGVAKLVVIAVAAATVGATGSFPSAVARAAATVLIAASANLANGLDVRPGRALKVMAPICLLGLSAPSGLRPYLPGLLAVLLPALVLDLRERAMLGDGGANLLGFAAGLSLASALGTFGLVVGASLGVVLNVLAETVTLTRMIERSSVARAFDRLGRVPD